jgi:hypothetical protein
MRSLCFSISRDGQLEFGTRIEVEARINLRQVPVYGKPNSSASSAVLLLLEILQFGGGIRVE